MTFFRMNINSLTAKLVLMVTQTFMIISIFIIGITVLCVSDSSCIAWLMAKACHLNYELLLLSALNLLKETGCDLCRSVCNSEAGVQ